VTALAPGIGLTGGAPPAPSAKLRAPLIAPLSMAAARPATSVRIRTWPLPAGSASERAAG